MHFNSIYRILKPSLESFALFNITPSGGKTFILSYCCDLQDHVVFEGWDGKYFSIQCIS